jgi:hypothetical protein
VCVCVCVCDALVVRAREREREEKRERERTIQREKGSMTAVCVLLHISCASLGIVCTSRCIQPCRRRCHIAASSSALRARAAGSETINEWKGRPRDGAKRSPAAAKISKKLTYRVGWGWGWGGQFRHRSPCRFLAGWRWIDLA